MQKSKGQSSKKYIYIGGGLVLMVIAIFVFTKLFKSNNVSTSSNQTIVKKSQEVNKEFTFPIKGDRDEEVAKIKFIIEKVETTNEIVVKGQKATAISGRTFLIVNLKIANQFDKSIQIDTKDYFRLSVNGNDKELLAPDIHNDPVEVQAISTKYTRVGFPVNTDDRDFVLQVGEIKGNKEKIKLDLK